jgi:hypothetical protein
MSTSGAIRNTRNEGHIRETRDSYFQCREFAEIAMTVINILDLTVARPGLELITSRLRTECSITELMRRE